MPHIFLEEAPKEAPEETLEEAYAAYSAYYYAESSSHDSVYAE